MQGEKSYLLSGVHFILRCDQLCSHCFVAHCSLMIAPLKLILKNYSGTTQFKSCIILYNFQNCLEMCKAVNLSVVLMVMTHGFLPCGKDVNLNQ